MLAQLQRSKGVHRTFTGLEATVNVLDQASIFIVLVQPLALQVAIRRTVGNPRQLVSDLPTTISIILKQRFVNLARLAGTIKTITIAVPNVQHLTPGIYAKLVKAPKIHTEHRQLSRKKVQLVVFHVLQATLVVKTLLL